MTTDSTKAMTLEQAIAYLHLHVNSSHNADWKTKREAWDVLMAHLAPREVSDEEVERVAQYLYVRGWSTGGDYDDDFKPDVRTALQTIQADRKRGGVTAQRGQAREGRKLVPVEPTDEMLNAANRLPENFSIGDEWKAMLAAAPYADAEDK